MATRAAAQEQRHLRSVYDALDARNYKQALKLIHSIQQKGTDTPVSRALKALCLERTHERAEAYRLCLELLETGPVDDPVVIPLYMTLKRLQKPEDCLRLYETAYKKDPSKEGISSAYYTCLIRLMDWTKQQQLALRMFKQHTKSNFYWWYITSCYMQGVSTKQRLSIDLARKTVEKMLLEGKKISLEEFLFYIEILRKSQMFNVALAAIQGPLGEIMKVPIEKLSLEIEFQRHMDNKQEVLDLSRTLLSKYDSDSWAHYVIYIDTLVGDVAKEGFESALSDSIKLFIELKEIELTKTGAKRGPFLAHMYLLGKLADKCYLTPHPEISVNFPVMMKQYFDIFGTKRCFVYDLEPYLKYITNIDDRLDLISSLLKGLEISETDDLKTKVNCVMKLSSVYALEWKLGIYKSIKSLDEVLAKANGIMKIYLLSTDIDIQSNIEARERGSGDDLAIVLGHLLYRAWELTGQNLYIFEAICVLVNALVHSKYNYDIKIMLVRLYSYFGAFQPAFSFFTSMEIKHIQLDSMSYLVLEDLRTSSKWKNLDELCESIIAYHEDYYRENPDYIMSCLSNGSYGKVEEFMDLYNKLSRSYAYKRAVVERSKLGILESLGSSVDIAIKLQDSHNAVTAIVDDPEVMSFNDDAKVLEPWNLNELFGLQFPLPHNYTTLQIQRDAMAILLCRACCNESAPEAIRKLLPRWKDVSEAHYRYVDMGPQYETSKWNQKAWEIFDSAITFVSKFPIEDPLMFDELAVVLESILNNIKYLKENKPAFSKWKHLPELSGFIIQQLPFIVVALSTWSKILPKKKGKKADELKPDIRVSTRAVISSLSSLLSELVHDSKEPFTGPVVDPGEGGFNFQIEYLRTPESARIVSGIFSGISASHKETRVTQSEHLTRANEVVRGIKL